MFRIWCDFVSNVHQEFFFFQSYNILKNGFQKHEPLEILNSESESHTSRFELMIFRVQNCHGVTSGAGISILLSLFQRGGVGSNPDKNPIPHLGGRGGGNNNYRYACNFICH